MRMTSKRTLGGKHMSTVIYDPCGWESVAEFQRVRLRHFKDNARERAERIEGGVRITSRFGLPDVYEVTLSASTPRGDGIRAWTAKRKGKRPTEGNYGDD